MFFCVFTWVVYVINILEKASLGTSFRLDTVASSTTWPDHILIRSHIFLYRLFQGILVNKVVRTIVQKSMLKIYAGKREGCCSVYFRSSTESINWGINQPKSQGDIFGAPILQGMGPDTYKWSGMGPL